MKNLNSYSVGELSSVIYTLNRLLLCLRDNNRLSSILIRNQNKICRFAAQASSSHSSPLMSCVKQRTNYWYQVSSPHRLVRNSFIVCRLWFPPLKITHQFRGLLKEFHNLQKTSKLNLAEINWIQLILVPHKILGVFSVFVIPQWGSKCKAKELIIKCPHS